MPGSSVEHVGLATTSRQGALKQEFPRRSLFARFFRQLLQLEKLSPLVRGIFVAADLGVR
jgi:hypothetical protein